MSGYTREDLTELFEWDWAQKSGRSVMLHHVASFTFDPEYETSALGVASCGIESRFSIPGFISRMDAKRCPKCCDALGWSRGVGSPKNDDRLRPWVEARLASLRALARPHDGQPNPAEPTRPE